MSGGSEHRANLANAMAVVGMAGRFPGADSVSGFWRNRAGAVADFGGDELSLVDLSSVQA
jgi:hypothetical protein